MRGISAALLLVPLCALAHGRVEPTEPREIRIVAVGDLLFGRYLRPTDPGSYRPVGRGPDPLAEVAPLLRAADVAIGNLETPIVPAPARLPDRGAHVFRAEPGAARLLRMAGLRVLSLANNHTSNLGLGGAAETRRRLIEEGIRPVGAGATVEEALQPALIDAGGLRLAVLAFTLWNGDHAPGDPGGALAYVRGEELLARAAPLLRAARADRGADWVAVSLHWGVEYAPHPDEAQRRAARALVDAGADLVLGHHPHVLQDVEVYRGRLIAYSLGNFLFDNPALSTRQTAVLRVVLSGAGPLRRIRAAQLTPVLIGRDGVPRPAVGPDHQAVAQRLRALAPDLAVTPDPAGGLRTVLNTVPIVDPLRRQPFPDEGAGAALTRHAR